MSIDEVLNRLEAAENDFVGREFMAPVIGRDSVVVRIAGVLCRIRRIEGLPGGFRGWAILRALSTSQARFAAPATLTQIQDYLSLFPSVRLLLIHPHGSRWLCRPAQAGDRRFSIEGLVPLELVEEGLERFETVLSRFDGRLFWYERRDPGRDPAVAAYLRERLEEGGGDRRPPAAARLRKRSLTREERAAYELLRAERLEALRDRVEVRLSEALDHAGACYRSHSERRGVYVVRYEIDGRQHVSTVNPSDLSVVTAGICLSGADRRFDLTSLVGVLREAHGTRQIHWVGHPGEEAGDA
jgi:hypothetical protein